MERTNEYVPIITRKDIKIITKNPEYKKSIEEYKIIKKEYKKNTPLTENVIFQDVYIHLYKLNERFKSFNEQQKYFQVFDKYKDKRSQYANDKVDMLDDIIKDLNGITGNKELVFASKMLNTIFGDMPIIDSHIGKAFGRGSNISVCNYKNFKDAFKRYQRNHDEARLIINNVNHNIPKTKEVDFVLWMWSKINK